MDADTFEQVTIPADIFGDRRPFLQDGMTIQVEYYEEEALNAMLPDKVTCTVVETEPAVKGQTAANSLQAGDPRQRRPHHDPALRRRGRGGHRLDRDAWNTSSAPEPRR